ncbi:humpty dumpty [Choristoneura fumiferana]|uniref:humpty dumpty n=1 Tax=Choristoneura fumiferana TaxID=7141 RepID=UPI003D155CD8
MEPPTSPWKKPNEVLKLHRLKKRKLALQERMKQQSISTEEVHNNNETSPLDFSRLINGDKRKNPFLKTNSQDKKAKIECVQEYTQLDESNDKTLFALLNLPAKVSDKPAQELETNKLATFSNLLQRYTAEHSAEPKVEEKRCKYLPIDWALTSRVRLMSPKPFAWTAKLKASEEASGITGFVRCLDTTTSSTLDTSPRARFHQTCLYWQHPHLPWLELFPRSSGRVSATSFMATNEEVKEALLTEWKESFRSLFQLVRALHCPYFYVCANTFTVLFRAAGVCGATEPVALVTPTTRGFRQTLRQEDVEFTMPLRPDKKRLNTSNEDKPKNSSFDSCYDTMDGTRQGKEEGKEGSGDEEDPDEFLSQLGLETSMLQKINNTQARIAHSAESSVDSAAESLVLVRGADAQALFNFLLNCKSIVSPTGPLAGVPPTLLSPTAFHGGTLQSLKVRENIIHSDNQKYFSIELRGPILPTTVHSLAEVLRGSAAQYSATFAHHKPTVAFSWAAANIAKDESAKENEPNHFTKAFNKENLSDCGISEKMLQHFCSADPSLVTALDSIKYNPEDNTYTW